MVERFYTIIDECSLFEGDNMPLFERVEAALESHAESSRHATGKQWARAICKVLEKELDTIKAQTKMLDKRTVGSVVFGARQK